MEPKAISWIMHLLPSRAYIVEHYFKFSCIYVIKLTWAFANELIIIIVLNLCASKFQNYVVNFWNFIKWLFFIVCSIIKSYKVKTIFCFKKFNKSDSAASPAEPSSVEIYFKVHELSLETYEFKIASFSFFLQNPPARNWELPTSLSFEFVCFLRNGTFYWVQNVLVILQSYRSRQYYESKVLHNTEVTWYSTFHGSLKTDYFNKRS